MCKWFATMALALLGLSAAFPAVADGYPVRPLTMIVPFPKDDPADALGRFLGERLGARLGQPIVIESAGAAGVAGADLSAGRAVRAAADGYTLSLGSSNSHVLPGGDSALPFDLVKDLAPVMLIGGEPLMIAGRKDLPADDLKGLIGWLQANPMKASAGIAATGDIGHLASLAFQKEARTAFRFVLSGGDTPALQDLITGRIDLMIAPASHFKALAAGSVKPFATTGRRRLASALSIPTADEAGVPGFFASLWYGLWVAKNTSRDIIAKLNATMTQVMADPKSRQRLTEFGLQISTLDQQSPEALAEFQKAEATRWWPLIKGATVRMD